MKTNSIIFIFTSVIYNLINLGNDNYHFISSKFLADVWYVLMYSHLLFLFYNYRKANIYANLAFKASIGRLIYNFGIFINLVEHTPNKAAFFVPCFIVVLLIYENYKWLNSRLKRLRYGFTTRH